MTDLYQRALEIAQKDDFSTPKNSVVLYSISYLPTAQNKDNAFAFLHEHPEKVMIDNTVGGKKLVDLGLLKTDCGLSNEQIVEIWTIASTRFITNAKGNVTAFVTDADKRSVFRRVELPHLLSNPKVTSINNQDKFIFAQQFAS